MITIKKRILSFVLMIILIITTASATGVFTASTASVVTVSSVSNVSSGVKIQWKRDKSKSGYYIYRKNVTTSKWTKIKTVKDSGYTSWTDTTAANGVKYDYKVEAYRGKRVYTNSTKKTIYRLSTPSITSLSYNGDSIRIKSNKNSNARGFEIQYSTSSSFKNAKSQLVPKTQLDFTIPNLTCGKKYYFRIRAYKVSKNVYHYSGFSSVKTYNSKPSYTAYTTNLYTSIYAKPDSSSKLTVLHYMTKVTLYQDYTFSSKGVWKRLKYNGKYYYSWIQSGDEKFTKVKNKYQYDTSSCNKYQKEIVNFALNVFKNLDTEYDRTKKFSNGTINKQSQKYPFDCSGFVRYVHNSVMQKYVKTYKMPWNLIELFNTEALYNNGLPTEFKAVTVCEGKYDYSKLQPGDVIFFNLENGKVKDKACNHCGIYLGNREFIHSTESVNGVTVSPISRTYETDFVKAVRFIPNKTKLINETVTANKSVAVYNDEKCKSGTHVCRIKEGIYFKLICTNADVGYIEYTAENGKTAYGYIYKPQNTVSGLYNG